MLQHLIIILLQVFVTVGAFDCPGTGLYVDPTDCSKYCNCPSKQTGCDCWLNCADGQHFDPKTTVCVNKLWTTCNSRKTTTPFPKKNLSEYRRVCRYSNSNNAKYTTEQLKKETSCTHIIYTYAKLNEEYLIEYSDKEQDIDLGGYKTVTDLKSTERKVLLSIGALDDSEGRKFSQLVMYQTRIQNFIKRAIKFLKEHNFDGLDIDWRYPACSPSICNVGVTIEKTHFANFVKEVRREFNKQTPRLLLTAVLSGKVFYASQSYDIRTLYENLDFINLMNYGYREADTSMTGHHSPLSYHPPITDWFETESIARSVNIFLDAGANRKQIVVGISTLGNTFTLSDSRVHGFNVKVTGFGDKGDISQKEGFLAYSEICKRVKHGGWTEVYDNKRIGPYAYLGNQWTSYLDVEAVKLVAEYVTKEKLGGAYISHLEYDDFKAECCGIKSPLLNTVDAVFNKATTRVNEIIDRCSN